MVVALLMVDRLMVVAAVPEPRTTMSEEVLVALALPVLVAWEEPLELPLPEAVVDASVEAAVDVWATVEDAAAELAAADADDCALDAS